MAIKTCKDCTADVKEKFLSEAGEYFAVAVIISLCQSHIRPPKVM